jgi:hypothetical protein
MITRACCSTIPSVNRIQFTPNFCMIILILSSFLCPTPQWSVPLRFSIWNLVYVFSFYPLNIMYLLHSPCFNDCSNVCQYTKKSCSSFRKELLYSIVIELIVSMKATELISMCFSKSIAESVYVSIRQKCCPSKLEGIRTWWDASACGVDWY